MCSTLSTEFLSSLGRTDFLKQKAHGSGLFVPLMKIIQHCPLRAVFPGGALQLEATLISTPFLTLQSPRSTAPNSTHFSSEAVSGSEDHADLQIA